MNMWDLLNKYLNTFHYMKVKYAKNHVCYFKSSDDNNPRFTLDSVDYDDIF